MGKGLEFTDKISDLERLFSIVEGYMDAISHYIRGVLKPGLLLGTALTDSGRLRRNTNRLYWDMMLWWCRSTSNYKWGMENFESMDIDIRILQISGAKDPWFMC